MTESQSMRRGDVMNEIVTFSRLIRRSIVHAENKCCADADTMIGKVISVIGRALKIFVDGNVEARRRHQAYEELAGVSKPELNDIGISRTNIRAVVAGVYPIERFAVSNVISVERRRGSATVLHSLNFTTSFLMTATSEL